MEGSWEIKKLGKYGNWEMGKLRNWEMETLGNGDIGKLGNQRVKSRRKRVK
jgi:hypothetical protein